MTIHWGLRCSEKSTVFSIVGFVSGNDTSRLSEASDWVLSRIEGPVVLDLQLLGWDREGREAITDVVRRLRAAGRLQVHRGLTQRMGASPNASGRRLLNSILVEQSALLAAGPRQVPR